MSENGSSQEIQSPPATSASGAEPAVVSGAEPAVVSGAEPAVVSGAEPAVVSGWSGAGSFVGSILAGTLLGYLADNWLNTRPWFIVVGIVLGSYSGFMKLYRQSEVMEKIERRLP